MLPIGGPLARRLLVVQLMTASAIELWTEEANLQRKLARAWSLSSTRMSGLMSRIQARASDPQAPRMSMMKGTKAGPG